MNTLSLKVSGGSNVWMLEGFFLIDGMVIAVGCSHPGIETIVEAAIGINPRILFIAGGGERRADRTSSVASQTTFGPRTSHVRSRGLQRQVAHYFQETNC
jgi:hypothetical protein